MKLLLDTCTLVWLVSAPDQLSAVAAAAIDSEQNSLHLSDASVLELCLKWQAGKLGLPRPPRLWVEEQASAWRLLAVPLSRSVMYRLTELPDHHRDPFDRLLVSQAIENDLTIVTPDPAIGRYPAAVLW